MEDKLTQEMKKHAVIVAIHAIHSDHEISQFFNVVRSFIHKVRRELEAFDGNVEHFSKRRKRKTLQTQLEHHSLYSKSWTLSIKTFLSP